MGLDKLVIKTNNEADVIGDRLMSTYDEPSAATRPQDVSDPVSEADLERVLTDVPRGALVLCAIAVALLLAGWLAIYFGIFLPRGPVS